MTNFEPRTCNLKPVTLNIVTFADHVLEFNRSLNIDQPLPEGVSVLNPFKDEIAFSFCKQFYRKYYNDNNERTLIIGINPGRLGGGLTGIPFTDPVKLEICCNIQNSLQKKVELSADFIYRVIETYGGPEKFYKNFYFTAVSPLGFKRNDKNLNYYDIRELQDELMNYIIDCMKAQLNFGVNNQICFCLGEGSNFKFLSKLNETHNFFKSIVPLPHPRFIMQYKRKQMDKFIGDYIHALSFKSP